MESIIAQPPRQTSFKISQGIAVKFFAVALLLAYAFYQFSTAHLVMLVLAIALVLAVVNRIHHINAIDVAEYGRVAGNTWSDGGAFHYDPKTTTAVSARAVVHDGGSFKRSSANQKAGS